MMAANKRIQQEILAGLEAQLAEAKNNLAEITKELKDLCGLRNCETLKDGRKIYQTKTLNPSAWYYEDGQLAPEAEWPK